MILRLLLAAVGAVTITIGLFLFMDDVANRFVLREPIRYFAITDYIRAPDRGRQLPEVPVTAESAPDRPQLEYDEEDELPVDLDSSAPPVEAAPLEERALTLDE